MKVPLVAEFGFRHQPYTLRINAVYLARVMRIELTKRLSNGFGNHPNSPTLAHPCVILLAVQRFEKTWTSICYNSVSPPITDTRILYSWHCCDTQHQVITLLPRQGSYQLAQPNLLCQRFIERRRDFNKVVTQCFALCART